MEPPTNNTFSSMQLAVESALLGAGERPCRILVTKTTRRRRYASSEQGFRILMRFEPSFVALDKCSADRMYLCVECAGNRMKTLRRYESILREAGFQARLAGDHFRKTRRSVYIERVFDRSGNEL
jgi:hypothetical protein